MMARRNRWSNVSFTLFWPPVAGACREGVRAEAGVLEALGIDILNAKML